MTCSNCGARLSCGCQKRAATDGKQCCTQCITNYNNSIKKTPQTGANIAPNITNVILQK